MAGDWTAIEHSTPRKAEIASIAQSTGRSRHEVLGLLVEFWAWVETQTKTGRVQMPVSCLPGCVGADAQFWCAVVRAGWIELHENETPQASTCFSIPRANHWLSRGAKARLAKNRRQSKWRSKRKKKVDAKPSTKASTTEQNRTEEILETTNVVSCGEAAEKPLLVFPCCGKGSKAWNLTSSKLAEYRESFPGIDALGECRKALQWCRDNPTKIKTSSGVPAFLSRWLGKAQDQGKQNGTSTAGAGHRETHNEAQQRATFGAIAAVAAKAGLRVDGLLAGDDGARRIEADGGIH